MRGPCTQRPLRRLAPLPCESGQRWFTEGRAAHRYPSSRVACERLQTPCAALAWQQLAGGPVCPPWLHPPLSPLLDRSASLSKPPLPTSSCHCASLPDALDSTWVAMQVSPYRVLTVYSEPVSVQGSLRRLSVCHRWRRYACLHPGNAAVLWQTLVLRTGLLLPPVCLAPVHPRLHARLTCSIAHQGSKTGLCPVLLVTYSGRVDESHQRC